MYTRTAERTLVGFPHASRESGATSGFAASISIDDLDDYSFINNMNMYICIYIYIYICIYVYT